MILGLCIVSRYIKCIDTLVTIWLAIYRIKSIDSHNMYQNIFLAIKSPHKILQSSVLLHFYQFTANIIHIWFCQIYRNTYCVLVQSINDTIYITDQYSDTELYMICFSVVAYYILLLYIASKINILTAPQYPLWNKIVIFSMLFSSLEHKIWRNILGSDLKNNFWGNRFL